MPRANHSLTNVLVFRTYVRFISTPATPVTSERLSYSRFHLADLQVHTAADPDHEYGDEWGAEPDPAFAELLVGRCREAGVTVIAVTDHNRLDWFPAVHAAGHRAGVAVFP